MSNKKNKKIFFCILMFLLAQNFFPTESATWTIAACKFSFRGKNKERDEILSVLPQLILENLSENIRRKSFPEELFDEASFGMKQKRLSLFLQLSEKVQERDSIALFHYGEKEMKARIRDAEKKIAVLKKQIDESIAEEKKEFEFLQKEGEKQAYDTKEKSEKEKFIDLFKSLSREREIDFVRDVALYKNDTHFLFESGNETPDFFSNEFIKKAFSEKVNALITGKVFLYSNYVSLTIELISYPSAKIIFTYTDAASLSDIAFLAKNAARALASAISNSMPSELHFVVEPKEALADFSLSIDDTRYRKIPDVVFVDAGVHSILFSSAGFKKARTNYAFAGNQKFTIRMTLEKDEMQKIFLKFEKPVFGDLFADGKKLASLDEKNQTTMISINNEPILGEFISRDGKTAPFYLAGQKFKNRNAARLSLDVFDRNAYIDKRRRLMYTSYSVLMTSALATFFTYGTFSSKQSAFARGTISVNDMRSWQIASWSAIGITAGCGVWFIYELVRYFIAADKVLPSTAKKISNKNEALLQNEIEEKLRQQETGGKKNKMRKTN